MSRRRSIASATTPATTDSPTIGRTRTRPTMPRASPRWFSGTIRETCQRMAAVCIIEPAIEMSWLPHSRRKSRWRSATRAEALGAAVTGGSLIGHADELQTLGACVHGIGVGPMGSRRVISAPLFDRDATPTLGYEFLEGLHGHARSERQAATHLHVAEVAREAVRRTGQRAGLEPR